MRLKDVNLVSVYWMLLWFPSRNSEVCWIWSKNIFLMSSGLQTDINIKTYKYNTVYDAIQNIIHCSIQNKLHKTQISSQLLCYNSVNTVNIWPITCHNILSTWMSTDNFSVPGSDLNLSWTGRAVNRYQIHYNTCPPSREISKF